MILEKGSLKNSDLSRRDCFGSTPLHFASVRNKQDVISQLVEAGCDPFTTNNDGRKPSDLTTDESIKMYLLGKFI